MSQLDSQKATAIITGGTSGLGYESAKAVVTKGWQVIVTSRNLESAQKAAEEINNETKTQSVFGMGLELASQASIRSFATELKEKALNLQAIVCNAGIMLSDATQYTDEGIEKTFAVNHLGHFLLTNLLLSSLKGDARIVFVSSGTHIPDHKLARRSGTPAPIYTTAKELAYAKDKKGGRAEQSLRYTTSKLCNVLCANEIARRLESYESNNETTFGVYSIDPGLMPDTGLSREYPQVLRSIFSRVFSLLRPFIDGIRTAQQSGQDIARLVTDPELSGIKGTYYDGQHEVLASPVAYELDKAKDLWDTSVELVGLSEDESPIV